MTDKELKELKDTLWHSADVLRASAHLAANKYGQPILGLIFLRYADILYKQHKEEIEAEYNRLKGGRMEKSLKEISIEKCGFYLPECAYYDFLNDAPDDANKANRSSLLVVDWYKDEQPRAKLKYEVELSLNDDLPESYDKAAFDSKVSLLMNHFVDMAVQGYGWIGVA